MRHKQDVKILAGLLLIIAFLASSVSACSSGPNVNPPGPEVAAATLSPSQVITIGDIDPDDPGKKIQRFSPLANYLAANLEDFGIKDGRVVIAQDMEEMAGYLRDGTVDIYFDSAYPTLNVQSMAGSQVILRRWKDSDSTYWSVYVALKSSEIVSTQDLVGKVIAFEEPYSTSGFVLPAGALIEDGFVLTEVSRPEADLPADKIGYFFTWDEENTVELLMRGRVSAGAISNQDYDELPDEIKEQIVILGRTTSVPRQLVSLRPGTPPGLSEKIAELLTGLDQFDEGIVILEGLKDTRKFDSLPSDSESELVNLRNFMALVLAD